MPRSPTTADAFTAIAEGRRREILQVLSTSREERDVSWLVDTLGWPQPQVSKHLGVLRKVGLVKVERQGKRRLYRLNAEELRPVFEWVKGYEKFWSQQLDRIQERAEDKARNRGGTPPRDPE